MRYVLIAAFNTTFSAFMPPQALNDMLDEDIVESNRRAVLNGQIPEQQAKKLIVYRVGFFDDDSGNIEVCEPVKLCALKDFLPRKATVVEEVKVDDGQKN